LPAALNLSPARAFLWVTMREATGHEPLPVERARAGDPEAWDALFRRYQLPLFAWLQELLHDEQTSLDLVQETFAQATRHIGSLRDPERFGAWLFGIAHQKCRQHWRKQRPARAWESLDAEDREASCADETDPAPDEWLIRKEAREQFYRALAELTPEHRAVVLLHFLEGFSLEEIGRVTGAPVGTVKSRLHYARKALKTLLQAPCHENAP
jgi:RNA polymerase sigma-70 factor (ECF subfamily)